ncbi:hypothetical protein CHA01nite_33820 [Chryseobacterium hagamense]|uniref:Uncharacterized protein n=2 Tax=Chryseobacterium hagamense TaxID=395935 RepID=A0A511YR34_9FLAO|nr:hypothetical protein [Chryseobacterium hagamense]GEN77642.1 hypothetical protein CHA01nite_33820 [Chryseobacterium hagamense]
MESIRKELIRKATLALQEKIENLQNLLGENFGKAEKNVSDGFKVTLPTEMYRTYEAYNSSSLALAKFSSVSQAAKSVTSYYQPVLDKEFDFVIGPVIHEPVIQVMYEIKLNIRRNPGTGKVAEQHSFEKEKKRFRLF